MGRLITTIVIVTLFRSTLYIHIYPSITVCEQTLDVSAGTLNLSAGTSLNPKTEGLRACSELRIHNHSNEQSSSNLVPKVVPSADKAATSRQELELLFHHHITILSTAAKPCQEDSYEFYLIIARFQDDAKDEHVGQDTRSQGGKDLKEKDLKILDQFNSKNSDAVIESFSPSPIPVEGSESLMKEIDIFLTLDDSIPSGIKNDDYDSKGDILFLEELLSNESTSLPENESFHFDVPSSPRPPAKPPDDDGIYFDDEPTRGVFNTKVMGNISKHYVLMPRLFPTQPTLCLVIDTLLLISSENKNKVHLLSHRGFKAFHLSSESPMMIYGGNTPTLEVQFLHFYPP
nr:hypothetical protein [Tanacetum cinerariifolium]